MGFSQGDIVLVSFPFTMGNSSKVRPAIVVSNKVVNKTEDVILAQITSKPRKDDFTFLLNSEELSVPLFHQSQVRCHKIFIIHKTSIIKKISFLNEDSFSRLREKIFKLFE